MQISNFKTKYINEPIVVLSWERYQDGGGHCLWLKDPTGETLAVASVNLPHIDLKASFGDTPVMFVKDYSENEGMVAALEKAGVIERTGWKTRTGFVEVEACKILVPTI